MTIIHAPRASAILYDLLLTRKESRPFLLPANTCPVVPLTFLKAGAPFEFVDISPSTLHMDLDLVRERMTRGGIGGMIYVHTYGEPSTPNAFFAEARAFDPSLLLVDDRCLCVPEFVPSPASEADLTLYSTGYAKIVDLGSGGYAFLRSGVSIIHHPLAYRGSNLAAQEQACKEAIASRHPFNYLDSDWLDTGSILPGWQEYRSQVEKATPPSLEHRARLNAIYTSRLPVEYQFPAAYQAWRFSLRLPGRDSLLQAIFTAGLFASAHYTSLAGIFAPGYCPVACALSTQVINLFNDHHYTQEMAEATCEIILNQVL